MRTYIQIDVQNLFFSAKDLQKRIDFLKLAQHFKTTEPEIIDICAYIIRTPDAESKKFENFLHSLGYSLIIKKAIKGTKPDGSVCYTGTDQDMAIAVDCMKRINDFDKWILMSGDGDFIDLCKHLKEQGKNVEVWSVKGSSFNKRFCDYVDTIRFLNDNFFYDHTRSGNSKPQEENKV